MSQITSNLDWKRVWRRTEGATGGIQAEAQVLRDYTSVGCLILLGPPGVGKSTELRAAYQETVASKQAGVFISLRQVTSRSEFLSLVTGDRRRPISEPERLTLFLDGLDELPADDATLQLDLLDALTALADEGRSSPTRCPPRLRLTCRAAELPDDFVHGLEAAWDGDVALLRLDPLGEEDILLAVGELSPADASRFSAYMDTRGLRPLASNPMTLRMLVRLFEAGEGNLPENLAQVYRASTSEMLTRVRGLVREDDPSALQRTTRLLGRLAAVCALSGKYVLWTGVGTDVRPPDAIAVADASGGVEEVEGSRIQADEGSLRALLRPGFFEPDGPNRFTWPHRSFVEFLAADYLAQAPIDRGRLVELMAVRDTEGTRVIPQLREVASWLAGMDAEVRRLLIRSEPILLLRSDVAGAEDSFKAALLTELLNRLDAGDSEEFRLDPAVKLDRLSHPGLAGLLAPWISGRHLRLAARRFAVDVARHCHPAGLSRELVAVALTETESPSLRALATVAAGELNADAKELGMLKVLLETGARGDPQDEVKGAALRVLWPLQIGPEALFTALSPPRDDSLYGWYKAFIYDLEPSAFGPDALIAGLQWLDQLHGSPEPSMVFRKLVPSVVRAAWAASENDAVRAALAEVLIAAAGDYHHSTRLFDTSGSDLVRLEATATRREQLFSELVARAGKDGSALAKWTLYGATPLLLSEDLSWVLDRARQLPDGFLTEAIHSLAAGRTPDEVARLWDLRDGNPEVARAIERLFSTDLNGPAAGWARASFRRKRVAMQPPEAPDLDARIRSSLDTCSDRPEEWWRLNLLLLADALDGGSELSGNLATSPGWLRAGLVIRAAVVKAAYRYVLEYRPENLDWLGTNTFNRIAAAGYRALRLLSLEAPSLYEAVPSKAWAAWAPAVLWFPNNDSRDEKAARARIAERAYNIAPGEFVSAIHSILKCAVSAYDLAGILEGCLDEQLSEIVWRSVLVGKLDPASRKALIVLLVQKRSSETIAWIRELLRDPAPVRGERLNENALEVAAPAALLQMSILEIWDEVWARRFLDQPHALEIWRATSHGYFFDASFLSVLSPSTLADLYAWLKEVHVHEEFPTSGYITTDHELAGIWHRIPGLLASMAADEAFAALSQLAKQDAEDGYVQAAMAQAREHRLGRLPRRLLPEEVLGALGVRPTSASPGRKEAIEAAAGANAELDRTLTAAFQPVETFAETLPVEELMIASEPKRSFLLVATEWQSGFGGVSSVNRELACALAKNGHRVWCIVPEATSDDIDSATRSRVELIEASPMPGYSGQDLLDACPRPMIDHPDFVVGHDHVTGRAAMRIRNTYFSDAAYIHALHTIPMVSETYKPDGRQSPAVRGVKKNAVQMTLCDAADLTLAIGPQIFERFSSLMPDASSVHQLVPGLSPDLLTLPARTTTPILPNILWVGRGDDPHLKGLPVVMHLAALLQHEKPDGLRSPKVVLRGLDGHALQDEVDRLFGMISVERRMLECHPFTADRATLIRDYRSAMCFVMPSAFEAFGMVAFEAIALGLPIVVSSQSGVGQFLVDRHRRVPGGIQLPDDAVLDVYDDPARTATHWAGAVRRRLSDPTATFAEAARLRDRVAGIVPWETSMRELVSALNNIKQINTSS